MSARTLEIHPASESEKRAAFLNVFEMWPMAETADEHLERRLRSVSHQRAEWWVAVQNKEVVASLGTYPTQFGLSGRTVAGISIGAVHTRPDCRGQGLARQLLREVESQHASRGTAISLLFSDISPTYYARLGYRQSPSLEFNGRWPVEQTAPHIGSNAHSDRDRTWQTELLRNVEPHWLARLTRVESPPSSIRIERTTAYWEYQQARLPHAWISWRNSGDEGASEFWILEPLRDGRVRVLLFHPGRTEVQSEGPDSPWPTSGIKVVIEQHLPDTCQITGWCASSTQVADLADRVSERRREITMLKSIQPDLRLEEPQIASARRFHFIDHV